MITAAAQRPTTTNKTPPDDLRAHSRPTAAERRGWTDRRAGPRGARSEGTEEGLRSDGGSVAVEEVEVLMTMIMVVAMVLVVEKVDAANITRRQSRFKVG